MVRSPTHDMPQHRDQITTKVGKRLPPTPLYGIYTAEAVRNQCLRTVQIIYIYYADASIYGSLTSGLDPNLPLSVARSALPKTSPTTSPTTVAEDLPQEMSTLTPKAEEREKNSNSLAVFSPSRPQRSFLLAQSMLRALAASSTLVALSVMVTSEESVVVFGIRMEAHYNYSSAFRFLLGVDSIVCVLSVLSLVFLCRLSRSESNVRHYFLLFLHDLVIMVLMISGCSAASAIGYVGRYGEEKMGWFSVCSRVAKFCNQVLASVILSYLAFFCYFALSITSAHKLTLLSVH